MINIFKKIDQIKYELDTLQTSNAIKNFHIALRLNNELYIYLLCDEENKAITSFIEKYSNENVEIKTIFKDEYDEDIYYQNIFKEPINIKDSRRRFVHLLDENSNNENLDTPCPVVTFYSYKGGMGRSTTLASFATALANGAIDYQGERISPKKVVIIDCDFEAPGFTNYFLNNSGIPYNQNGIVEYLTDIEFDKDTDIQKYMWDVAKDPFAGKGEIWVMPAGNLSTTYDTEDFLKNNLNHYLEGLARLDIASPMYLINRIKKDVIDKIYDKIKPDFILIDSRTGFNDIFGITALELSKVMIGFFGNNAQTHPGLHFFIDTLLKHGSTNSIIVNSILPESSWRELFEDFKNDINDILKSIQENGDEYNLEPFKIRRQSVLEKIGIKKEDKRDFIDLITQREFADYKDLFDKIYDLSIDTQKLIEKKNNLIEEDTDVTEHSTPSVSEHKLEGESPKIRILKNLQRDLPNLYADQRDDDNGKPIDFQKELDNNRYFFRKCMEDLFNISRFLIIGNKGTGKSYIYESLKNENIVNALQKKANKPNSFKYHFFHLIELENVNFFVDTNEFDDISKGNVDKYFSRFWKVFIWRSIMKKAEDSNLYATSLSLFLNCETPTEISKRFNEIIQDDDKIIAIERDLLDLDKFLNSRGGNEYIVAIFDPLDKLINPNKWKDRIAPLINFWRKRPYSKIFPKIFVRKDLLSSIGNINNFQEIENQAINIEWTKEELFAYFFTLVTSSSHRDFFDIMKGQLSYSLLIEQIERKTGQKKQFPIEEDFLRLASSTFFGKYADRHGRDVYGESYDWIYKNLQNTDGTISLRPFIDLIECSIDDSLKNNNDTETPILHPDYFTSGPNRKKAIERYLKDLIKEPGNDDLELFFEFFDNISKNPNDPNRKFLFLKQKHDQFDLLLKTVIQKYPKRIKNDVKGLKDLLEQNGIVKRNSWDYSFALLYKYRLGLK